MDEIEKKVCLDEEWIGRFIKLANFSAFEYFSGKKEWREQQKVEFFQEKIRNPRLDYPKLQKFNFDEREKGLLALKKEIIAKEENESVKQAYTWQLNAKIAELRMMRCTFNGDDQGFLRYSEFIFGTTKKDIFEIDLNEIKKIIKQNKETDPQKILAKNRLNNSLNFFNKDELEEIDLSYEENSPARNPILVFPFAKANKIAADKIKEEFEQALRDYNLDDWKVVIDENITAITTSQEKKQILIPIGREVSEMELKALVVHEVGTHALRRKNGEKSRLALLGYGLDRFLKGEEGIAKYEEQKIQKTNDFSGFDGYLAIGLTLGLDGIKRDFREVFNILRDYYFIKSKQQNLEKAWLLAKESAWKRCVRTFRGTTCSTPGVCFTQDLVYREGNIDVWELIKNNPAEQRRFAIGKYDPTNPRHIWILDQLGISEKDI